MQCSVSLSVCRVIVIVTVLCPVAVLFDELSSSCVSHVKIEALWQFFFIAVLYCQYILQLNWLFTVKRLDCFVPEKIF